MNDRYLFRAKHVHAFDVNKKYDGWVYGFLSCENYIYSPELGCEKLIDPSTICQCTGLKDKNGKLIFEKDIIRYEGMLFVVKWNDVCAHFAAYKVKEKTRCTPVMNSGTMKITEVIGNIFDNMELLEAGKEAWHQGNQNLIMPAT